MSETRRIRDVDGDFRYVTDGPECAHRCDGEGWTWAADPDDRIAIACPVHRPTASRAVRRTRGHAMSTKRW